MNIDDKNRVSIFKQVSDMEAKALQSSGNSFLETADILETIALATTFINPPVGIVIGLAAMINSSLDKNTKNNKKLSTTRMPDSWLKELSDSEVLSDEGLKFLTKKLNKKGYISVEDALNYVDLENKVSKDKKEKEETAKLKENEGVLSILNKAEKRLGKEYIDSSLTFIKQFSGNVFDDSLSTISRTIQTSNKALDIANVGLDMLAKKIKKDQ